MTWFNDPDLARCVKITVAGASRRIIIGIYKNEQSAPQEVRFTLSVFVRPGFCNDDITSTLNYDCILEDLDAVLARGPYRLQETMDMAILEALLAHPEAAAACVSSRKMEAYPDAEYAGVELFRKKEAPQL